MVSLPPPRRRHLFVLGSVAILLVGFTCFYTTKPDIFSLDEIMMGYPFDVFLWFRGFKTHSGFVDHLHKALDHAGVKTFRDDLSIEPGEDIEVEILKAINNSSVKLVVISSAEVSSLFLDELVLMVEKRKSSGHLLLPIFYHVHPSVVKFRTAPFSQAFLDRKQCFEMAKCKRYEALDLAANPIRFSAVSTSDEALDALRDYILMEASRFKKQAEEFKEQILRWEEALNDIAGLKPVVINEESHESEAVKLIVGRVVKHIAVKQSSSKALLAISQ